MTKLFVGFCAAALVLGLSFTPTLTYAQDDQGMEEMEGATDSGDDSDATEDSSSMEEPQEDAVEEAEESAGSEGGGKISEATNQADCEKAGGHWRAKKDKCVEQKPEKGKKQKKGSE